MGALTKAELALEIFNTVGLNKREAKDLIDVFFEAISACLEKGKNVKLSGFGNICLRDKKERPGRNPKTGKEVKVTARRVATFKPSDKLKKLCEEVVGPKK